jgi:hypothetical protein
MSKAEKKVTAMLPTELLNRAMKASGEGLTPTLRKGLELVAAKDSYRQILKLKGKYRDGLGVTTQQLKADRE